MEHIEGIERVERLQGLESLSRMQELAGMNRIDRLEIFQADYRLVQVPAGATVYADPPYRSTANSKRYTGKGAPFDFEAFDEWLASVDFPVFVSEYDAPRGCVEYAAKTRTSSMSATTNVKRIEKIFVQERFAADLASVRGTLF